VSPFLKLAYQPYKWIIVIPFVFLNTVIMGLTCIFTGLLFSQDAANFTAVIWSKLCCAVVPLRVMVTGKKNYSPNKSYVVVANHQSMADIPVIHAHLGLNIKWIMKKELGDIPLFGTACRALGCIVVDRQNHEAALKSIQEAKKKLSRKACVLFFAEGTRSRDGQVMPFKKGAFRFAWETRLPILPVTIKNSARILPSDSLDLIPGTVDIIIHRPIYISDHHLEQLDEIIEQSRNIIAGAV
jgi:1-acyl-sn-glycerol-3-phosphate acyltransferase